ncbi:hypothetical protein HO932_12635, partial [Streptococcus suis]|nr:hypothetical protein [Streptococcus suis]
KGQLRPKDFVYDEHFDCVLCPEHQALTYRTTTREVPTGTGVGKDRSDFLIN